MTTVQFDSQKIEQLLNTATSERQRKMYQALLDKARKQERSSTKNKRSETIPSTEKTAQTTTKSSTKTQKKTKTVKKNQKVATQSTTTEVSTTTKQPSKQSSKTLTESSPLPPAPVTSETIASTSTATEQAPQTEPQSQSKKKKKKQPATKSPIFQALGTLIATPYFSDERAYIKINGGEYKLSPVGGRNFQTYTKLKKELKKNGSSPMFLRVYPKASFDYKTQQARIVFSLVNFSRDCEKINEQPPGFMLRGIWQYIPHSKTPVITIYRNHEQKKYFKTLGKTQQLAFARPIHIPVVWDAPVEPFKYNPEAEKDAQMPRYFVEVRAILKDGLFVVEEMLSEPSRKIPKFIKISKSSN